MPQTQIKFGQPRFQVIYWSPVYGPHGEFCGSIGRTGGVYHTRKLAEYIADREDSYNDDAFAEVIDRFPEFEIQCGYTLDQHKRDKHRFQLDREDKYVCTDPTCELCLPF